MPPSPGTATALDSGQRAAHAVADALQGSSTALDRYSDWSTGLFEEFTRQRRQQYEREGQMHEQAFWRERLKSIANPHRHRSPAAAQIAE